MKLKSKNSFLKRLSCIALSLMLCLTSFTLAGFVPTIEAEAATSKEVLHYTFDNGTRYDVNGQNQLTEAGWGSSSSGTDYYCNSDGGVHGSIVGLNGLNNWTLTYVGRSIQNLDSSKQEGSCEIGLGTTQGNTDVIRISSYGHIYYNGTKLAQANVVSAGINTIEIEYKINALIVRVNSVSYGPYTVDSSLFSSVNYLYSGLDSGITIGSHEHYIYDIVATTVDDTCVTKADFETAFTNFENKINGTLYTNIKPAYDAYVNARKVYDAFYYGNDIALTNISDALLELEAQTAKLTTEWQSPTGTAVPSFANGAVGTNGYSNLLYSNKLDSTNNVEACYGEYSGTKVYHRIANNQTVMLYDGVTTPKMPIFNVDTMESKNYRTRYTYAIYPVSGKNTTAAFGDLYFPEKWYNGGQSQSSKNETNLYNFDDIYGDTSNRIGNGPNSLGKGPQLHKGAFSGWIDLYGSVNVLYYNPPQSFASDTSGAYSKKYNLTWLCADEDDGKSKISDLKVSYCTVNDKAAIYVVNYKPLRDKIVNAKNNIPNNLTNVKQGGLSTYLDTLNTLMSYNPNSSFSGVSSVTDGINNFNSAMTTNMNNAANLTSNAITSDNSAYDTIRTEIVNYRTIQTNKSYDGHSLNDYTDASKTYYTTAYNNAVKYMALVDNNGYDLTTTEPKNIADTLTNARTGLTLKSFTIKFKYANGDTTKGDKYTIYTKGTSVKVPANSKVDYDDNYHYSYSWPTIEDVTADKTYEEIKTPIGHTLSETPVSNYQTGNYDENKGYTHSYNCSDCSYVYTQTCTFVNQGITGDKATVTCSVCGGTYTLDIKAYKDIVSVAQEAINDKAKYDSDSRANLQTVLNNNTVNDCITIKQVDAKISAIQTAINKLVLNKYSITVKYVDELGNDLKVGEKGATSKTYDAVDYGTIQNVVAPTNYNRVDYAVYKWTRNRTDGDIISGLNSSSLDVVVKGDSTYYVFLKNTSVDESQASGNAVITLNNKSNKVYDIGYVDLNENTPVSVSKNTITIGTVTLTAPNYSFYNITGFNINGKIITGTDTVSITKDTVIRPVYEAKQTVRITRASAGILINGNDDDSVDVEWNKKIVMTYNGVVPDGKVVIWKDGNGNVLAQGSTYSFYANSNVTISATVEASAPAVPTASIGMFSYDATDNKVTVVNNFYVPDGMAATKAGVILSTKNSTREALIAQTNGKFEGDESQFTTDKNQIRISVSRTANTSFTMYALAYVVVDGTTYYANEVKSINYTPKSA